MGGSSSNAGDSAVDESINLNNGGMVATDGSTINVTDGGAVTAAFDFGKSAIKEITNTGEKVVTSALKHGENALDKAFKSNDKAVTGAFKYGEDALSEVSDLADSSNKFNEKVLNSVMSSNKAAQDQSDKQLNALSKFATTLKMGESALIKDVVIYLVIAVVIIGFFWMLRKGSK